MAMTKFQLDVTRDVPLKAQYVHEGVKIGIRFAAYHFLSTLPSNVSDSVLDKTVDYLIKEYMLERMQRNDNV